VAKLKAPLLSLGASGAIGKSIVYFPWKGLDCAREYVIPANPKSDPQVAQRAHLTEAVEYIHAAMAAADNPLDDDDKSGYALAGSIYPTPRTWFNTIVKSWVDARVHAEKVAMLVFTSFADPDTGEITIILTNHVEAALAGFMYCGISKTAMLKKVAADGAGGGHTGVFTGLTKGVKYYFQFRPTKVTDDTWVMKSGIYHHVCT